MFTRFTIIFTIITILVGCIPSSPKSNKQRSSLNQTNSDDTPVPAPTYAESDDLYWFADQRYDGTITINQNTLDRIYLRGKDINNFLTATDGSNIAGYAKTYCIVAHYQSPYSKDQFRIRAIPISFTTNGTVERLLRLDIPDTASNQSTCTGDIDNLDQKNISSIFTINSKIYIGTDQGLYISSDDGVTFQNITTSDGLGDNNINNVYVSSAGTIYAATNNGLSYSVNNGQNFSTWSVSDGLGSNTINDVYISTSGTILVATSNGLSFKTTTDSQFNNRTTGNQLPSNIITSVYANSSGIVFAGTGLGLAKSTDATISSFSTITTTQGLGSNSIRDIYIVGSSVYVATTGGLSISTNDGTSFINKTTSHGLGSNSINGVNVNGIYVYAATDNGLAISLNNGATFTNKTTTDGLNSNTILDIMNNGSKIYAATNSGFIYSDNLLGTNFYPLKAIASAYNSQDLCPGCFNILSSGRLDIYQSVNNQISNSTKIYGSTFNLNALTLRIDTSSSYQENPVLCSTDGCRGKGFDCCINGQCVHDGLLKPNATNHSDYTQASIDVQSNPLNFFRWPNIYYVCGAAPYNPTPTPTATPDAEATAEALLEQYIAEYNCLEGGKKDPPSYANCSPSNNYSSWDLIRRNVWLRCGCVEDMATPGPNDPSPYCPDFSLRVIKDINENITAVVCDIPQPSIDPTPFQNLNQLLIHRSVPHRYFAASDGIDKYNKTISRANPVDDLAILQGSSAPPAVEGTPFMYLDKISKTAPVDTPYSMNAILGQMSLELDEALPAQVVHVEFDQIYIISSLQGAYYSSCSNCQQDSWYSDLTSNPVTYDGIGLRSSGHTTSRSQLQNNYSFGNYEDTIFGRACWIPPTMIPFSHKPNTDLQTQRLNRLQTQAAFFVNGYQRDWYGFNKGAVIGSFDGVTWFAIGTGRRVIATSKKLFIAINSPYGDVADYSSTTVHIVVDLGGNQASSFDYDPALAVDAQNQNKGATCQAWHQCATDTDCITKLGWEYICGDISKIRTPWPSFSFDSIERTNTGQSNSFLTNILQGNFPTGSMKRCVYRGAGSLCKANYSNISNPETRKIFTCAPNFYCATKNSSAFNDRVIRELNLLSSSHIQLGQEADVLGRPVSYVNAGEELTTVIRDNLKATTDNYSSDSDDWGLCRPGKAIVSSGGAVINPLSQHQSRDPAGRTDYINQIAGCNSNSISDYLGNARVSTCPLIDDETGNYVLTTANYTTQNYINLHQQNSCGAESQHNNSGDYVSSFNYIEADNISSLASLFEDYPSVVRDACQRRAGTVCHTNLDCSPNRLHGDFSEEGFDNSIFGGTLAEKKYWNEYLVCGQSIPKPSLTDSNYATYDMGLNRCCRAVEETLTMYTGFDSTTLFPEDSTANQNLTLVTSRLSKDNPRAAGRYSRYTVAYPVDSQISPSAIHAETPNVNINQTPNMYQWKTINDTGKKTCCGGGFIRKFADGSHDWTTSYDRLKIDAKNFKCLNYQNTLAFLDNDDPVAASINQINYDQDYPSLCKFPHYGDPDKDGGCVQIGIDKAKDNKITLPQEVAPPIDYRGTLDNTAKLDTSPYQTIQTYGGTSANIPVLHSRAPYMPIPYAPNYPSDADDKGPFYYIATRDAPGSSFYLPIYIGGNQNITRVAIKYFDEDDKLLSEEVAVEQTCSNTLSYQPYDNTTSMPIGIERWCTQAYGSYGNLFHIKADAGREGGIWGVDDNNDPNKWAYAGIVIEYYAIGTDSYIYSTGTNNLITGLKAGNDLYYLTKLGRLELTGIPQIFYEPIYCNSDRSKMVDGIFNGTNTRTAFQGISFIHAPANIGNKTLAQIYDSTSSGTDASLATTTAAGGSERITFSNQLSIDQIFSAHEFTCCQKLNTVTTSKEKCCSGFAQSQQTSDGSNILICKLPARTDLNVYFNRFVSSEGVGEDITESARLDDDDFIPETGEPKLHQETTDKLRSLGILFCSNGDVFSGGVFGNFNAEPFGNISSFQSVSADANKAMYYSIADNNIDANSDQYKGEALFAAGLRWNHHLYCK